MPTTHWTLVIQAAEGTSDVAQSAWNSLCGQYWYPLYAHARRLGRSSKDAEDLVQGFFEHSIEATRNCFQVADKVQGRFRSLLLTSFTNFLADEWDRAKARKRCPETELLSIDAMEAEGRFLNEPVEKIEEPGLQYDRTWAQNLLRQTQEALEQEYERRGGLERYKVLRGFLQEGRGGISYRSAGELLGISEGAVTQSVFVLRRRYGEILRAKVRETVDSAEAVDEEIRYLVRVLTMVG